MMKPLLRSIPGLEAFTGPTLRALLGVVHGEEECEGGAHCLLSTATQTAVLHFTSKQFTDDRLAGGA